MRGAADTDTSTGTPRHTFLIGHYPRATVSAYFPWWAARSPPLSRHKHTTQTHRRGRMDRACLLIACRRLATAHGGRTLRSSITSTATAYLCGHLHATDMYRRINNNQYLELEVPVRARRSLARLRTGGRALAVFR